MNITIAPTQFYTWKNYRCAYDIHQPANSAAEGVALLLIHPIGVGLSRQFWQRFRTQWYMKGHKNTIYNPDLLGCGESDMPHIAYTPQDWAEQLHHFLEEVVKQPVVIVVQGALLPVAIELVQKQSNLIKGMILAGPPTWPVISKNSSEWQNKIAWNILDSPLGNAFYRYARREKFLRSFSIRQLFGAEQAVDREWLDMLIPGAENPESRHAVFSFLAGFWRRDYSGYLACIKQPTLVVVGETASSISKEGKQEKPDERLTHYLGCLPEGTGVKLPGRNILPYESTAEFIDAIAPFIDKIETVS
ncbi:alpha/beta fold hydrolase [Nodularia chucula]|uniref:alpha/beta fold hydrolase n=1 Tax=Nodularia chucula TaxID=3093667 RepID=UPI0039C72F8C